jgi:DNA polymerase III alpha subunit
MVTANSIYMAAYEAGRRNAIRLGLSHVMRLSRHAMGQIVGRRDGGYVSVEDFMTRAAIHPSEAETLAYCGAMNDFGHSRPELLWKVKMWEGADALAPVCGVGGGKEDGGGFMLFHSGRAEPRIPSLPDYSLEKRLECEREAFGFHASISPVTALMSKAAPMKGIVKAIDLPVYTGRNVGLIGRVITAKRTRTAQGEFMKFLTMEDDTDIFEVILFPRTYARYSQSLASDGLLFVAGKVETDNGDVSIVGKAVSRLTPSGTGKYLW